MKKFEYLIEDIDVSTDVDQLNELGDEGWELAAVDTDSGNAIFKRILSQDRADDMDEDDGTDEEDEDFDIDFEEAKEVCIFEDHNVKVTFKGLKKGSFLFGGDAYSVKFLIENNTLHNMSVSAVDVTLNGFVLENDTYIASEVPARRKKIDFFNLKLSKLNECDIYSISDIDEFEMKIAYEIEDINKKFESRPIIIKPFEIYE